MLTRLVLLLGLGDPPALASQSAGITGTSHHPQPEMLLILYNDFVSGEYYSFNSNGLSPDSLGYHSTIICEYLY